MKQLTIWEYHGTSNIGESDYVYAGFDKVKKLHRFRVGDTVELFAKRKSAGAAWHLRRGSFCYEFCKFCRS